MSPSTISAGAWRSSFERRILYLTSIGGVAVGLIGESVSSPGFSSEDVALLLAICFGIASAAKLLLDRTDPIPVMFLVVVLVGAMTPFVEASLATAMSAVLVGVLAVGVILIKRTETAVALIGLGITAVAIRPILESLGLQPANSTVIPTSVSSVVSLAAVLATGLAFRSLRDQIVHSDIHQARMMSLLENTAYQVKSPLTAALGYAYLARSESDIQQASIYADGMIRRGWEASLALDDLMILSRSATRPLDVVHRRIDMNSTVAASLDSVIGARAKLVSLNVQGFCIGDPMRVKQTIRHLVSNATLHGGAEIAISGDAHDQSYEIRVHDTGAPLHREELDEMFEPFHKLPASRETVGRGIGLSVSRVLAEAMGGDLRIEAQSDGNSAVLTLPLSS